MYHNLLAQFRPGQQEFDRYDSSGGHHVAILAVFDHDWEQHLLVQQCSTGPVAALLGMDSWEFALYHVTGEMVTLVHTFFDATHKPWVEAATMVAHWSQHGHYGGLSNAIEALTG